MLQQASSIFIAIPAYTQHQALQLTCLTEFSGVASRAVAVGSQKIAAIEHTASIVLTVEIT